MTQDISKSAEAQGGGSQPLAEFAVCQSCKEEFSKEIAKDCKSPDVNKFCSARCAGICGECGQSIAAASPETAAQPMSEPFQKALAETINRFMCSHTAGTACDSLPIHTEEFAQHIWQAARAGMGEKFTQQEIDNLDHVLHSPMRSGWDKWREAVDTVNKLREATSLRSETGVQEK